MSVIQLSKKINDTSFAHWEFAGHSLHFMFFSSRHIHNFLLRKNIIAHIFGCGFQPNLSEADNLQIFCIWNETLCHNFVTKTEEIYEKLMKCRKCLQPCQIWTICVCIETRLWNSSIYRQKQKSFLFSLPAWITSKLQLNSLAFVFSCEDDAMVVTEMLPKRNYEAVDNQRLFNRRNRKYNLILKFDF